MEAASMKRRDNLEITMDETEDMKRRIANLERIVYVHTDTITHIVNTLEEIERILRELKKVGE